MFQTKIILSFMTIKKYILDLQDTRTIHFIKTIDDYLILEIEIIIGSTSQNSRQPIYLIFCYGDQ